MLVPPDVVLYCATRTVLDANGMDCWRRRTSGRTRALVYNMPASPRVVVWLGTVVIVRTLPWRWLQQPAARTAQPQHFRACLLRGVLWYV